MHDVGAFLGEPDRDARADALAAAGDENDFVREFHEGSSGEGSLHRYARRPGARESLDAHDLCIAAFCAEWPRMPSASPRFAHPAVGWLALALLSGAEPAQLPRPLRLFGRAGAGAARPASGRRVGRLGGLGLHARLLRRRAFLRLSRRPVSAQISDARRRVGLEPRHGGHGAGAELHRSFSPSAWSSAWAKPASSRWDRAGFPISSPGRGATRRLRSSTSRSRSAPPSASPSAAISRRHGDWRECVLVGGAAGRSFRAEPAFPARTAARRGRRPAGPCRPAAVSRKFCNCSPAAAIFCLWAVMRRRLSRSGRSPSGDRRSCTACTGSRLTAPTRSSG